MNKNTLFIAALFFVNIMASCCKIETVSLPAEEPFFQEMEEIILTRADGNDGEAYIRIGMYETIDNHSVTISNMWIETRNGNVELPEFGNNILTSDIISASAEAPTFDTENGDYHCVLPCSAASDILVHFDALVSCEQGNYTLPVTDVTVVIKSYKTNWKSNQYYSYELCINADTLGLVEITFDPEVSDFEDVNI